MALHAPADGVAVSSCTGGRSCRRRVRSARSRSPRRPPSCRRTSARRQGSRPSSDGQRRAGGESGEVERVERRGRERARDGRVGRPAGSRARRRDRRGADSIQGAGLRRRAASVDRRDRARVRRRRSVRVVQPGSRAAGPAARRSARRVAEQSRRASQPRAPSRAVAQHGAARSTREVADNFHVDGALLSATSPSWTTCAIAARACAVVDGVQACGQVLGRICSPPLSTVGAVPAVTWSAT